MLDRLLGNAAAAARSANHEELRSFGALLDSDRDLRAQLLRMVENDWKESRLVIGKDLNSKADILHALLSLDNLWRDGMGLWVTCLSQNSMPEQDFSRCIGVICNKLTALSSVSFSDADLTDAVCFLEVFPQSCLNSVLDSTEMNYWAVTTCLELISPCIDTLSSLCKRKQIQRLRTTDPVVEIIDHLLDLDWGSLHSKFINILCDMHTHLTLSHIQSLKVICKDVSFSLYFLILIFHSNS